MSAFKDWLNGLTGKTTPVDADELYLRDSSGTPGSKKLTWANLKATLKTYFDGLYQPLATNLTSWAALATNTKQDTLVSGTNIKTVNSTSLLGSGDVTVSASIAPLVIVDANTVAQRNGTNAQAFRIYNTYTDASNYERGFVKWASNVLEVGTEAAGTGTGRELILRSSGDVSLYGVGNSHANAFLGRGYFCTSSKAPVGVISGHENQANWKSDFVWSWGATSYNDTQDAGLIRAAAGVVGITGGATAGGAAQFVEMTAPAAPSTNGVRIYAEDNGSGKTRLMARFATGSAVQIAIEP